jgi:hypothetical protein
MSKARGLFCWVVFTDIGSLVAVMEARRDADYLAAFLESAQEEPRETFGFCKVPALDGVEFPAHTITVSTLNGDLLGRFEFNEEALFFASIRTAADELPRHGKHLSLVVENGVQKVQVTNGQVHFPGGADAK